jgi:hypothetical protein
MFRDFIASCLFHCFLAYLREWTTLRLDPTIGGGNPRSACSRSLGTQAFSQPTFTLLCAMWLSFCSATLPATYCTRFLDSGGSWVLEGARNRPPGASPGPPGRLATLNFRNRFSGCGCNVPAQRKPGQIKHLPLRYAIVLPGRRSGFRVGFRPECSRESPKIGPLAGRRPAGITIA